MRKRLSTCAAIHTKAATSGSLAITPLQPPAISVVTSAIDSSVDTRRRGEIARLPLRQELVLEAAQAAEVVEALAGIEQPAPEAVPAGASRA